MKTNHCMLKTLFTCVFISMLCVALAGCGGTAGSSTAAGSAEASSALSAASDAGSAEAASEPAEPANPVDKFIGEWKIAAMQMNAAVVVGDFSMFGEGNTNNMNMTINDDGTGTMFMFGEDATFTWELADESTLKIKPKTDSGNGVQGANEDGTLDLVYSDEILSFTMKTDERTGTMFFSKDGTYKDMKPFAVADAKPITSEDALIGSWKLAGASMSGMTVYGDEESIEALGMTSLDLTIEPGGTAKLDDSETTWSIGEDGATIEDDFMGTAVTIPLLSYGDYLVLDFSEATGGTEMTFLLEK